MKIYTTTLMVDKRANCEKEDAELLLLGAKPVDLSEYPKLKYVYRAGIGCDNVPIQQIRERGIGLFFPSKRTRMIMSTSVAHVAFGWILMERCLDRNILEWYREPCTITSEKRICVVGFGHIGKIVNNLCDKTGLKVEYSDPEYCERDLSPFDILTFHVPLRYYQPGGIYRDNYGLISRELLKNARPNVTIINTSRGKIADEDAIADFLGKNPRAKYFSDVYNEEPFTVDNPLYPFYQKQFWGTPHIASYTHQVRNSQTQDVIELMEKLI